MAKFYVAAFGNDGFRPVVWGIGSSDDLSEAEDAARRDAGDWLSEASDPENATFELTQISAETFERIEEGEIDAVLLGISS